MLATNVADAPPLHPTPLDQDGLLNLFDGDEVGRNVVLQPATPEDMCGGQLPQRPSLEVVYDSV
jgi:chlorophyllide a reductase subunit X